MGTVHFFMPPPESRQGLAAGAAAAKLAQLAIKDAAATAATDSKQGAKRAILFIHHIHARVLSPAPSDYYFYFIIAPWTDEDSFNWDADYLHLDELHSPSELAAKLATNTLDADDDSAAASTSSVSSASSSSSPSSSTPSSPSTSNLPPQYAYIRFDLPLLCPLGSLLIGSKLDTDIRTSNHSIILVTIFRTYVHSTK